MFSAAQAFTFLSTWGRNETHAALPLRWVRATAPLGADRGRTRRALARSLPVRNAMGVRPPATGLPAGGSTRRSAWLRPHNQCHVPSLDPAVPADLGISVVVALAARRPRLPGLPSARDLRCLDAA